MNHLDFLLNLLLLYKPQNIIIEPKIIVNTSDTIFRCIDNIVKDVVVKELKRKIIVRMKLIPKIVSTFVISLKNIFSVSFINGGVHG